MSRYIDLTGRTFDRLTVLGIAYKDSHCAMHWYCICVCGNRSTPTSQRLTEGRARSCGCLAIEKARKKHTTHGAVVGGKPTPEYVCWQNMKARCNNPKHPSYKHYGGRSIKVCARWQKFENFIADIGLRQEVGLSIERINNDGDYSPNNCVWADRATQRANQRQHTAAEDGHCRNGHPYDARTFQKGVGCKTCTNARNARYRTKKRHSISSSV